MAPYERLMAGETLYFSEPNTGLWDIDDRDYAPDPDGYLHYHTHSSDGLHCYGDYQEEATARSYHDANPDRRTVPLPYCIYPCHMTNATRRDANMALLAQYP